MTFRFEKKMIMHRLTDSGRAMLHSILPDDGVLAA
jgi:hypothetical protein